MRLTESVPMQMCRSSSTLKVKLLTNDLEHVDRSVDLIDFNWLDLEHDETHSFQQQQSSFWCVVGDWWILAHFVSFGQVEPGPVAHHVTLDPVPATSDTHLTHPPVWASAAPSGVKIIKKKFFFTSPFQLVAVFGVTKCFPFSGKCVLCFLWNNLIWWFFSGAAAGF